MLLFTTTAQSYNSLYPTHVERVDLARTLGSNAAVTALGQLGQLLDLPAWVLGASPFDHVPAYPATGVAIAPIVTLAAVGTLLTVIGLAGLRRRDVG